MPDGTLRVQDRLNLVLPIRPGRGAPLKAALAATATGPQNLLKTALTRLGNVHFAEFVFLENDTRLGVFTIFDGDFDAYILSFTEHIGPIFNAILANIEGGDAVTPVQEHRDEFVKFIGKHNLPALGRFEAYPNRRRFDIADALEETGR
jgi:hypothetical protein